MMVYLSLRNAPCSCNPSMDGVCVCVLTVISKLKSSPVFFSNMFKNGCLMPRLTSGFTGHVMKVVL